MSYQAICKSQDTTIVCCHSTAQLPERFDRPTHVDHGYLVYYQMVVNMPRNRHRRMFRLFLQGNTIVVCDGVQPPLNSSLTCPSFYQWYETLCVGVGLHTRPISMLGCRGVPAQDRQTWTKFPSKFRPSRSSGQRFRPNRPNLSIRPNGGGRVDKWSKLSQNQNVMVDTS